MAGDGRPSRWAIGNMSDQLHSIGYLGPFEPNFHRLGTFYETYINRDGETGPIGEPAKNADGVFFGYLEKRGREFVAVRARYLGALVNLDNPVRLDPPRHTDGKKFGPHSSKFGDESARNLLCDMIDSNPSQAGELTRIGTESGLL